MSENPTLSAVLSGAMAEQLVELHTSMPGIVQMYDPATQTADIQPVFKKKYANKDAVNLPLLSDVPVMPSRTGKSFIHLPVKQGDYVLLVFAERSLEMFRAKGGTEDPMANRKHHLADAIAIPGIFPDAQQLQGITADHIHIVNETGKILIGKTVNPSEPILLGNVTAELFTNLMARVDSILDILIAGNHVLTTSPGDPTIPNPGTLGTLQGIKSDLADNKSTYVDTASTNIKSQVSFTERGD